MANVSALCGSFKAEVLSGIHALGVTVVRAATTVDTVKGALYLASGSLGVATTAYSATSEVSGTNYTAGGVTVTNATAPVLNGTEADWTPSASIVYTNVTLATSFDTLLLYNSTQSNRAIGVFTFGAQTVTSGTLTLTMPANTAGVALVRIA